MHVIILGSAAGGGVPQWNCGCPNCTAARRDRRSRTQSSVAVSADGQRWVLLNASPDLRTQLAQNRALWPRGARGSPVEAVVLALEEGQPVALTDRGGVPLGLCCAATAVARRPPRYAHGAPAGTFDVGLRIEDERNGGVLAYVPTAGAVDDAVRRTAREADLLLFDGTFWSDDELRAAGVEAPSAREMGHLPMGGPGGSLELLPRIGAKRTVLVHINNTNPILAPGSPQRAQVEAAGIVVGEDSMEFEL